MCGSIINLKTNKMKNLFLLSTDKPSRIIKSQDNVFILLGTDAPNWFEINLKTTKQNIYITNSDEIKEGDYGILDKEVLSYHQMHKRWGMPQGKKIILTTDADLVKDGVKAIPDDFLEWFIKNPSCEYIEVKPLLSNNGRALFGYKIIIPKEEINQDNKWSESTGDITSDYFIAQSKAIQKCMLLDAEMAYNSLPKQDSVYKCTCLRPQVNCFSGMCSYCNRQIVKNLTTEDLKPKIVGEYQQELFNYLHDLGVTALQSEMQEIERIVLGMQQENSNINALDFEIDALKREIKVFKHQQEQDKNKFSEEDLKEAFDSGRTVKNYKGEWQETYSDEMTSCKYENFKEWFEQFKNK